MLVGCDFGLFKAMKAHGYVPNMVVHSFLIERITVRTDRVCNYVDIMLT